jgi:hypothetical protein
MRSNPRGLRWGVFGALVLALACDLPLGLPRFTTEWVVPAAGDSLGLSDLLPSGFRVTPEGFVLDSLVSNQTVRLGDVCELCTCFSGPIPPVDLTPQSWRVPVPGGLSKAVLERGSARILIRNHAGFDLLDDGEGGRGFVLIRLTDLLTRSVLDSVSVSQPFPPDDSLSLHIDLAGLELTPFMVAELTGRTPGSGCDDVSLDPDVGIEAVVRLENVLAESVEAVLSDAAVALSGRTVSLPSALADRLRPGEADLVVEVETSTSIPVDVEVLLSVAGTEEDLFTENAALLTPLLIKGGSPDAPSSFRRLFVVNTASLEGADHVLVRTRSRIIGDRRVVFRGQEAFSYKVTLRAEIPVR